MTGPTPKPLPSILGMSLSEARRTLGENAPPLLASKFYALTHRLGLRSYADLGGLISRERIERLQETFGFERLEIADLIQSSLDGTRKYVFRLRDSALIETVLIPNRDHATLCVSSQAGCALECRFCATGRMGFRRNLEVFEIVDQLHQARRESGYPITDVVFMGMGEPLLNYDNVVKAAALFNAPEGPCISYKKITISTAGVVPAIRRYAAEKPRFRLVFSLTSADPEKRRKLMPITEEYPLAQLIDAIREYSESLGPRKWITIEYVAIRNVNMGDEDIDALAQNLRGFRYILNVIPYNPIGNEMSAPSWEEVKEFTTKLRRLNVPVKVRYSGGKDMLSGCGQLGAEEWRRNRVTSATSASPAPSVTKTP